MHGGWNRGWLAALAALLLASLAPALAAEPALRLTAGGTTRSFSAADLLARPDAASITLPRDASYGRPMTYRAVPLRALLAGLAPGDADTVEARATDGFVSQLPLALVEGPAEAWIAVEDPAHPWPKLPGKPVSAGPFYLVWRAPARGPVAAEQWPYALAELTAVDSPAHRWPAIAVAASLAPDDPARRGQALFATNCLPCHRLAGAGEGTVGPDLLRPMPATAYFTEAGLRALLRLPASVRTWPAQQMPRFDRAALSDQDIGAVIAYLRHLAARTR